MIKLMPISDCHLEFRNYTYWIEPNDADIICLLGDMGVGPQAVEWSMFESERLNKPIMFLNGNHEYYNYDLGLLQTFREMTKGTKVTILENDIYEFMGYRFLGCSLWSDFSSYGPVGKTHALLNATKFISDFTYIKNFTPNDCIDLHNKSMDWLKDNLTGTKDIVLTHFPPSVWYTAPKYRGDIMSPYFVNDLEPFILERQPLAWLSGHSHYNIKKYVGKTLLMSNQLGYKREGVEGFNPKLVIEL